MRRQRWHALGTWGLGRISSVAAVEQNLAFLIPPDKVAPALQVSHAAPSMTVQRNYISRRNAGMKNAYLFVFQQELMVRWRSGTARASSFHELGLGSRDSENVLELGAD
jgi:hypothetical protein